MLCGGTTNPTNQHRAALCQHKKPYCSLPSEKSLLLCTMHQHKKDLLLWARCQHKKVCCSMPTQKPCCSGPARKTMLAQKGPAALCDKKKPCYSVPAQHTLMLCAQRKKPCCSVKLKKRVWHHIKKPCSSVLAPKPLRLYASSRKDLVLCDNKKTLRNNPYAAW